jgi:hypothetical protein
MRPRTKVVLAAPVIVGLIGGLSLGTIAPAHADWHDVSGYLGCLKVNRIKVNDQDLAIKMGRYINDAIERGLDSLAAPGYLEDGFPATNMSDPMANIIYDCAQRFRP